MTNEDLTEDLKMLPISMVEPNDGQLAHLGLKQNPRTMKKAKFEKLKQDIIEYPELLRHRRLLVFPMENGKYIIIGGNMRYRAMCELKHKEVPVSVLDKDTPIERLNAYIILDNSGFGEWDWDMLANEWDYDMLEQWGLDVPVVEEVEVPDDLDDNREDKAFVAKITFKDERSLNEFQKMYSEQLSEEYDCIISVSGGKL